MLGVEIVKFSTLKFAPMRCRNLAGKRKSVKKKRYIHCLTVLSFFHLCIRPRIPEVTDNSPSEGGFGNKTKKKELGKKQSEHIICENSPSIGN